MKKKILLIFSLVFVFCLGMAVSAYSTHTSASTAASCCCCSGDSCPTRSKDKSDKPAEHKEGEKSCCCSGKN